MSKVDDKAKCPRCGGPLGMQYATWREVPTPGTDGMRSTVEIRYVCKACKDAVTLDWLRDDV